MSDRPCSSPKIIPETPSLSAITSHTPRDVTFMVGGPVDDSVEVTSKTQTDGSLHHLVENYQRLSPLVHLTACRRFDREEEVRSILNRLVNLLKSSSGDIPLTNLIISPLTAEYYYAAAGHSISEIAREVKMIYEGEYHTYSSIVQLTFVCCLDPIHFFSRAGEEVYGDQQVCRLLVHRLVRLCEGLLFRASSLATSTTGRAYAAIFAALVTDYEHYYGNSCGKSVADFSSSVYSGANVHRSVLSLYNAICHRYDNEARAMLQDTSDISSNYFMDKTKFSFKSSFLGKRHSGASQMQENAVLVGSVDYTRAGLSLQRKAIRSLLVRKHYSQSHRVSDYSTLGRLRVPESMIRDTLFGKHKLGAISFLDDLDEVSDGDTISPGCREDSD